MKIQFERKNMLATLKLVKPVTATRDIRPILQNVKIVSCKKQGAILMATDTETGIRVRLDVDVFPDGEGAALLPVKRMIDVLTATKQERLTLESDGTNRIIMRGEESGQWEFATSSHDEFPDVDEFTAESYHEIAPDELQTMIRRTIFATDKENDRFALSGVSFDAESIDDDMDVIMATATCGRRLATQSKNAHRHGTPMIGDSPLPTKSLESPTGKIVPTKVLTILDKVLGNKDYFHDVHMAFSDNNVTFRCGSITIFSRLVEGRFPRWRGIVPKTDDLTLVEVDCGILLEAVNSVKSGITDLFCGIFLIFESEKLTIIGQGKEVGKMVQTIPVGYEGKEKRVICLDLVLLINMLKALHNKKEKTTLNFFLPIESDPILIMVDGYNDYKYVVMPMSYEKKDMPDECLDEASLAERIAERERIAAESAFSDDDDDNEESDDEDSYKINVSDFTTVVNRWNSSSQPDKRLVIQTIYERDADVADDGNEYRAVLEKTVIIGAVDDPDDEMPDEYVIDEEFVPVAVVEPDEESDNVEAESVENLTEPDRP